MSSSGAKKPSGPAKPQALMTPDEKRALLAELLRKKAGSSKSIHPLSYNQRAMWFLHKLAPESAAYNTAFAVRIRSIVDTPSLKRAFQVLIERHSSLRTTFTSHAGEPQQEVHGYQEIPFEQVDALSWSEWELKNQVTETYQRPFDLEHGPVWRVNLFTRTASEHVLLFTVHHIVNDGWSMALLLDELRILYASERSGVAAALQPQDMQYIDYARWQTELMASPEGEKLWRYWQKQLSGELSTLDLPTDRPRPPVQTFRGASKTFTLNAELTQQIKELARAEGVTLFMALLAAFQVLLHRLTNQANILVGTAVSGRTRAEFEGIVGDLKNMIVVRAGLSNNPSFRTVLAQVRQSVLEGLDHQDYPFSLLVEKLVPNQDPSRSPLYQASFLLQKPQRFEELTQLIASGEDGVKIDFGGLAVEPFALTQQEGQLDLTIDIYDLKDTLFGSLSYNTDLFDAATITRTLGHFQTLLESIVANCERRISDLALLTEAERRQLLVEWNDTQTDYPRDHCIHQLFEAQVERTPDAVAVVFEGEQLTYRELNSRANQLAHYLRKLGAGPDVLVGICVERSLKMIVGLLGILKAGGAYVPLDPALPKERLAFMMEDAGLKVVVTQHKLAGELPKDKLRIICLDTGWSAVTRESSENPGRHAAAHNRAYVIYTSGSTGKPKGVMIPHLALLNYVVMSSRDYELGRGDCVLQFASLSFDSSVEEIFSCLTSGARLVLRTDWMLESASVFLTRCEDWGITVLSLPTAYWHELTGALDAETLRIPESLRVVIIGGERALADKLSLWQKHIPKNVRLINSYGPTETTVGATAADLSRTATHDGSHEVLIGRPIANAQTYVLDRIGQPVVIGVPGELYIGGIGLARGYMSRPDLTAERFLPNPFSHDPGARVYRTGDLVRYLPDGNLEYLGRVDDQVKIRGFRIELGEIEAALCQHRSVNQAVVTCREDAGEKRLVAYYTVNKGGASITELRRFLKNQLPEYMVPAFLIPLDTLPLTSNGKIDYRALPAVSGIETEAQENYVGARDELELQLTRIWEELLRVSRISIQDNFFELGGHSLLAIRMIARVEKELARTFSLASLFQFPTIEGLAQELRDEKRATGHPLLVPFRTGGTKSPLFLHGGSFELSRYVGEDQPCYGMEPHGQDGRRAPETVEEMATDYLKQIRSVQQQGPYLIGGFSFGGLVAYEMAQQLRQSGQEVELLVLIDPTPPMLEDFPNDLMKSNSGATRYLSKFIRHFQAQRKLGFQEQVDYVLNELKWRSGYAKEKFELLLCHLCLGAGFRLPSRLRMLYFFEISAKAARKYAPRPYHGHMGLLRSQEIKDNSKSAWSKLTVGKLEIYELPGTHLDPIKGHLVEAWGKQLKSCLLGAQKTESKWAPLKLAG